MFGSRKRFHMEALEDRQLMAGDVAAYVQNGNLYINEAMGHGGLDQGVRVYQVAAGVVRVEGAEANDGTSAKSLVNGQAFQDFMIPGDLFVNLGGGHDRLHLGFDGGGSAPSFGNISIDMTGSNLVIAEMTSAKLFGPLTPFNGPDDDQVFGWGFNARGVVSINTGVGSDWVFIAGSTIGDGLGVDKLTVNTGAGADAVSIKGATILGGAYITTYSNATENDADQVWFDGVFDSNFNVIPTFVTGNIEVYMGGGADRFYTGDPLDENFWGLGFAMLGSLHLSTGEGDDLVDVAAAKFGDANHWSNLSIYTGGGADDVTIDFNSSLIEAGEPSPELTGGLFISTYGSIYETDADVVRIPIGQIWQSVYIYLGGGDDTFELTAGNWGNYLTIDAGAGNDTGYFAGLVDNKATVRMGEGNDNLELGHVNAYQLNVDGGAGVDSLRKTQYLAVDYLYENSWEWINGRPTWLNELFWSAKTANVLTAM